VKLAWLAPLASFTFFAVGGCKKHATALARLDETHGQVEQTQAAGSPWRPAAVGDTFVLGNGVRTGKASRAKLTVGKTGKLDVDPEAVVYFTRDAAQKHDDVHVETGGVELEAGDEALGFGEALLEPNAKARVASTPQGMTVTVTLGHLLLEADDPATAVEAGKTVTVPVNGKPVVATAGVIDAGVPVARAKTGTISVKVTGTASKKTPKGVEPLSAASRRSRLVAPTAISQSSAREASRCLTTQRSRSPAERFTPRRLPRRLPGSTHRVRRSRHVAATPSSTLPLVRRSSRSVSRPPSPPPARSRSMAPRRRTRVSRSLRASRP
jgi:hypothetical protein